MSNKYCQELVELRNKPAHELKEVGDQWRTPDNIFWGINTLFGPFVLDLFTDGDNAKCAAYYTAEDNALAHDWSERLAELKGAAFGNPPYSRASQHEGQYITGMRYIMKHASAMRDKGGRYVFLIKAATSEVWWPEDADHIAFIRGRIGFELLNRPGFPGECFICELRLPDHRFRWKHNKLFLLLPEEYGPAFPAIVDCYTSPPT